jgi:hypothetical protein
MKSKLTIIALLIALCVSLYFVNVNSHAAPAQTWEYKFVYQCDEGKANKLAGDGWEMMSMGVTSFNGVGQAHCSFKRPK